MRYQPGFYKDHLSSFLSEFARNLTKVVEGAEQGSMVAKVSRASIETDEV